ncbi:TPA: WYL domain-containing protein [Kluyvera ascorbata]|uniref:WYL domain-containing protein n=1 Tax=Kluyvera genomosp. 3 TaxID=2774055 RepID=A0A6G9RP38_9ENTR|nr:MULTISPECIES: WYL domain-containing protein [Kluyvera]QIR28690.1 WYL domain-containing protein [Kluyvera genomosp. 3]UAK22273.1 WYL domain-containing protein [Kluyvera sp. CRP]HDT6544428.1 WYL domain-containing protein [Kluyvera ascorbata]
MKKSSGKKNRLLIERVCETFSALYQGSIIDKDWLCSHFDIAERTAYRDLARLSPLLDDMGNGRFKLSSHLIPSLHSGHLAEFAHFAGVSQLFPQTDGKSLRNRMKKSDNIEIVGIKSRDNKSLSKLFDHLDKAITARCIVTFSYREKPRRVQPYKLINHYGLWYLAGVDDGRLKAFELARIGDFSLSETSFSPTDDVIAELNNASGIRFGQGIQATLWVSAHAAQFVTRRPLFPEQRIVEKHPNNSLNITCVVNDKDTLFRWLRYWMPDIHITAPAALKDDFVKDFHSRIATANVANVTEASS